MSTLAIHGGTPVRTRAFPSWPMGDDMDVEAVGRVIRSGVWGGNGPATTDFSRRFAELCGAKHAILAANGTVTLEVAVKALGIGWDDEVIVPGLTFAATATAPLTAGAIPVFVDVDPETLCIDPAAVEAAITSRTRAIIPVHLGQAMADMDAIADIARRHGLAVIEDAAHSHGKQWKGAGAGSIGDFGSFSFQSTKILTCGEGGALTTSDEQLAERARSLIDCGRPYRGERDLEDEADRAAREAPDRVWQVATEWRTTFGANYRLGELQAALLSSQLDRFAGQMKARAEAAIELERLIADVPGIAVVRRDPRMTRLSFYVFIVRIDPQAFAGVANGPICDALAAEGIDCFAGYPPMHRNLIYQPAMSRLPSAMLRPQDVDPARWSLPVTERAAELETVYLSQNMFLGGTSDVGDIVEAFAKVQRHADELRTPVNAGARS
jgi:dTDP-4-amino-4,6-dideoxygalactose transaminase